MRDKEELIENETPTPIPDGYRFLFLEDLKDDFQTLDSRTEKVWIGNNILYSSKTPPIPMTAREALAEKKLTLINPSDMRLGVLPGAKGLNGIANKVIFEEQVIGFYPGVLQYVIKEEINNLISTKPYAFLFLSEKEPKCGFASFLTTAVQSKDIVNKVRGENDDLPLDYLCVLAFDQKWSIYVIDKFNNTIEYSPEVILDQIKDDFPETKKDIFKHTLAMKPMKFLVLSEDELTGKLYPLIKSILVKFLEKHLAQHEIAFIIDAETFTGPGAYLPHTPRRQENPNPTQYTVVTGENARLTIETFSDQEILLVISNRVILPGEPILISYGVGKRDFEVSYWDHTGNEIPAEFTVLYPQEIRNLKKLLAENNSHNSNDTSVKDSLFLILLVTGFHILYQLDVDELRKLCNIFPFLDNEQKLKKHVEEFISTEVNMTSLTNKIASNRKLCAKSFAKEVSPPEFEDTIAKIVHHQNNALHHVVEVRNKLKKDPLYNRDPHFVIFEDLSNFNLKDKKTEATRLYDEALSFYRKNEFKKAIPIFQKALKIFKIIAHKDTCQKLFLPEATYVDSSVAKVCWALARCYDNNEIKRPSDALHFYIRCQKITKIDNKLLKDHHQKFKTSINDCIALINKEIDLQTEKVIKPATSESEVSSSSAGEGSSSSAGEGSSSSVSKSSLFLPVSAETLSISREDTECNDAMKNKSFSS